MNAPTPSPGAVRAAEAILPLCGMPQYKRWAAEIIDRETGADVSGIEAAICREIAQRQSKGIAKYGQQLADNRAPLSERLQHAKEESMDQTCYLEWARVEAVRLEAMAAKLAEALRDLLGLIGAGDGHMVEAVNARAALAAWNENNQPTKHDA